jgi:histidinol-phosphate aminotransferase
MSNVRKTIQDLAGYVPGEQPQQGKLIKLNTNENPYPASEAVAAAIETAARNLVRYPDPIATGFRLTAAPILGVEPDWILCGNGSDDILTILTRTFVDAGNAIRLPYPSYTLYRTLAAIQGATAEEVAFNDDWTLPTAFRTGDGQLRLVMLPNPNSPTGTVVSREEILEIADALPCPLVVDEAYADFADFNCIDLVQENEKIIVTRTLSKSYGLAGLRFGFAVAQPQVITQMLKVKDSYNCDSLSLAAATAAISDTNWLAGNVAKIRVTRSRLQAQLAQLGYDVIPSHANFVWCTHSEQPAEQIYEYLKENGILVRYMKYPKWQDGLRISVGSDEQMDACLSLLEKR